MPVLSSMDIAKKFLFTVCFVVCFFLFKQYLKLSICSKSQELIPLHNSHFNTPRSKSYNKLGQEAITTIRT